MDIFQTCLLNGVSIDIHWIPRDLNSAADDMSKFIDHDDYTTNDTVFNALEDLWGPHTCDRFACPYNAKVQCFNTRFYQPGSSGVNAFSQDWSHHNNQLCPPVYLTCKVVSAQETLILPVWKSAHFWPLLCSDGVHWSNFIHGWVILPNFPNMFIACKATNSILVVSLYLFQLLCVLILAFPLEYAPSHWMSALLFLDNFAPLPLIFAVQDFYFLALFIQVSSYSASSLGRL